jgi:regulator of sirC expression with transglutaminase-like and TPR domain
MSIEGCNFPGHFLSKINIEGNLMIVDCFNGGKVIYPEDFEGIKKISGETVYSLVHRKTNVSSVIKRTLKNLENAYAQKNDKENRELFRLLLTYNF